MTDRPGLSEASSKFIHIASLALLAYGLVFIWRSSFVLGGTRFFVLFDDAMVSMRYARHLAAGAGLVWNVGEAPIEGFSNPLWTFFMAFWHLLPIPPSKLSLCIQLSSLLIMLVNLRVVARLVRRVAGDDPWVLVPSLVCTAFYYPLLSWPLLGMEVGLLTLFTTLAVDSALAAAERGRFSLAPLAWLSLASLLRIDALVPLATLGAATALLHPSAPRRPLIFALALPAALFALQAALRLAYFGDPLPNTYYLKMTGYPLAWRLARGAAVLVDLLRAEWPLWLLAGWGLFKMPSGPGKGLMGTAILTQVAYSVYVGGDAWEHLGGANRFICQAMPLLFVAAALGLRRVGQGLGAGSQAWVAPVLISTGAVLSLNGWSRMQLTRPLPAIETNAGYVRSCLYLREFTLPAASIAVQVAGSLSYFAGRRSIDLLGKSDRTVARLPAHVDRTRSLASRFMPGHLKWDHAHSITRGKPDVIAMPPEALIGDPRHPLKDYVAFGSFYFRKGSPRVFWDKISPPLPPLEEAQLVTELEAGL